MDWVDRRTKVSQLHGNDNLVKDNLSVPFFSMSTAESDLIVATCLTRRGISQSPRKQVPHLGFHNSSFEPGCFPMDFLAAGSCANHSSDTSKSFLTFQKSGTLHSVYQAIAYATIKKAFRRCDLRQKEGEGVREPIGRRRKKGVASKLVGSGQSKQQLTGAAWIPEASVLLVPDRISV